MYLLCIRGTLKSHDLEISRKTHNEVAGSDPAIAAARALGDLSHKVYVPVGGGNELLILDVWKDPAGIQTFFSNKQVQEGGAAVFSQRDPVVAMPARGAFTFSLQAPASRTDRYLGLIRGRVHSLEQAIEVISAGAKEGLSASRARGQLSHELFVSMDEKNPELIGVDLWSDLDGMKQTYEQHTPGLVKLFSEKPAMSIWTQPKGAWTEW